MIRKKYKEIVALRSEKALKNVLDEAETFIASVPTLNFSPLSECRLKNKKKMYDHQASDEPLNDPFVNFRVNTYFSAVDLIVSELKRRFLGR